MGMATFKLHKLKRNEEMKPENIQKQHKVVEQPVTEEINEEVVEQPVSRRRSRN